MNMTCANYYSLITDSNLGMAECFPEKSVGVAMDWSARGKV